MRFHAPIRRLRRCAISLLCAAFLAGTAPVVAHEHEQATMPMPGSGDDLGRIDFPTSEKSPEAQQHFVHGMLWLHLFEYPYAADEFRKAEQLDPDFALAYWGEAMTYTHAIWNQDDPAAARAALARLGATPQARAAKAPTAREKAFLDTGEQLFGPGTLKERDTRFLDATKALALRWPDDDEAQLLHALALLGVSRGERDVPNYLAAAAIARTVLAHNPQHPGAAHYWIHGMDDPEHAPGALEAARALAKIAPGAAHGQHMVSHIYIALGLWDEVIAANEQALRVADAQMSAQGKPAVGCFHGNAWLQYAYYQAGRANDGQRLLAECMELGARKMAGMMRKPDRDAMEALPFQRLWHASFAAMRATALIESEKDRAFDAAFAADIGDIGPGGGPDCFARGYAALQAANVDAARSDLACIVALAARQPGADDSDPHATDDLRILSDLLQGAIDAREGHGEDGLARVRSAAQRYESHPFEFGPPTTIKPPRELAGEILLQLHRPKEALAEFELSLKMAPGRAQSLLGRARALAAQGDAVAARQAYADLLANWHGADADLPALAEARAGAAGKQDR